MVYPHGSWSKRLSLVDGRNLQRFAVLCNRAPRDHDALLAEDLGDARVRQRRLRILRGNELLDERPDRGGGGGAARLGGHVAAEEILELEGAARRRHEFLRGDARNGAFVQPERGGDLAQDQGPHRDLAVLEEVALAVDNRLRHTQDGVEALLHVLDQPARLLQLRGDAGAAARRGGELGVKPIDAQARHGVGVQARAPHVAHLLYDDVGDYVARLDLRECRAGARIERLDQALRRAQRVFAGAGERLQPCVVTRGEQLQVLFDDLEREPALSLLWKGL